MICGELLWTTKTAVCWHTGQSLSMKDLRVDNGASCDSPACGHRGGHEAPVCGLRAASCGLRDEVNGGMRLRCSGILRARAPCTPCPRCFPWRIQRQKGCDFPRTPLAEKGERSMAEPGTVYTEPCRRVLRRSGRAVLAGWHLASGRTALPSGRTPAPSSSPAAPA